MPAEIIPLRPAAALAAAALAALALAFCVLATHRCAQPFPPEAVLLPLATGPDR